jgi:hypothetical protein
MTALQKNAARSPFSDYSAYVSSLKRLAKESNGVADWNARVNAALNGQASVELRRVSPLETRRKYGAFFTGTDLGEKLLGCGSEFGEKSVFFDPTCGMGDLLVAAAKRLPIHKTLPDTLRQWGQQLSGTDLHSEFIEGAKARLVLLARQRHKASEPLDKSDANYFKHVRVADSLKQYAPFERATHLLLNPPFGQVTAPTDCNWAGGRITMAAEFVVATLERINPGAELLAILPDVLRSGAFSEQWRRRVNELAEVRLAQPYGIFDESADVDVFLLRLVKREAEKHASPDQWAAPKQKTTSTIAEHFDVHVGRVVPHRDKKTGLRHPYIHARCVPTWTVMRKFTETRKHKGQAYEPPLVVIRRTSRPEHPYRAAASVIAGKEPVAIENHLIVCEPKDGKLATCMALMRQLKTDTVNEYLNARIRCRHLTVDSVQSIPIEL